MLLDFYNLREQPFGVTPDPRFLFLGETHREALASLFYGIEADRGFMALIADPGMGKTTLTFQLLEKLQQTARTVFLFQTQCNSKELFQYVLNDLKVDTTGMEIVSMHNKLNDILCQEMQAGRRFVLVIDEAQNLDTGVLETIRLLSNFETPRSKLIQIVLIGQPELAQKLADPGLQQFKQRIAMFARLEAFDAEDTLRYIAHRLKVAGYDGKPPFTAGALRMIAERSQGIPRNINSLCFSALSLGCALGQKQVDARTMEEVIADHDVESFNNPVLPRRPGSTRKTSSSFPSYRKKRPSQSRGLTLTAVSSALCLAAVIATLSFSPSRLRQFIQVPNETWLAIRNVATRRTTLSERHSESQFPVAEKPSAAISKPEEQQSEPLIGESEEGKTAKVQPAPGFSYVARQTRPGRDDQPPNRGGGVDDPSFASLGIGAKNLSNVRPDAAADISKVPENVSPVAARRAETSEIAPAETESVTRVPSLAARRLNLRPPRARQAVPLFPGIEAPSVIENEPSTDSLSSRSLALGASSLPLPPPVTPTSPTPVRAASGKSPLRAPVLIHSVRAVFPRDLALSKSQHSVRVGAVIDSDGIPKSLTMVGGDPSLVDASFAAVHEYRYDPALVNGEPVEFAIVIVVNFKEPE